MNKNNIPLLEQLFQDTCDVFEQNPTQVQSKSRKRELCLVRCIFCYIAYSYTRCSITLIGNVIGGRDHTSVIHQRNLAIDYLNNNDSEFIEKFNVYKKHSKYFEQMRVVRKPRKRNGIV